MALLSAPTGRWIPRRAVFVVVILVWSMVGAVPGAACVSGEQVSLDQVVELRPIEGPERSFVGLVEREVIRVWPQTVEHTTGSLRVVTRVWGGGSTEQELQYLGGASRRGPSTTNTCGTGLPAGPPMGDQTYEAVFETSSGSLGTVGVEEEALTAEFEALLDARFGTPLVLDRPQFSDEFPYAPPRPVPVASGGPSVWLNVALATGMASLSLLLLAAFIRRRPRANRPS